MKPSSKPPSPIQGLNLYDQTKSPKLNLTLTPAQLRSAGIKPLVTTIDPNLAKLISALKSLGFDDTNAPNNP